MTKVLDKSERKVKVVFFTQAEADAFESAPFYAEHFKDSIPLMIALGELAQCCSHYIDGKLLFVGGYYEVVPGVAELFLFPSVYIHQYPKTFLDEARWWVASLRQQYRRLQCWGEDTDLSKRWLSALGFLQEGTLRQYTVDGSSMTIWGIV